MYAPSDFKNEENLFKSLSNASPTEKAEKLRNEVREIENESGQDSKEAAPFLPERSAAISATAAQRDIRGRYLLAEELVLNKLSKEFGQSVRRDVRFATPSRAFIFDGVVINGEKVTAIEVKYFRSVRTITPRFREVFHSILDAAERLPDAVRNNFTLVLAVATDAPSSDHDELAKRLHSLIGLTPFPVEVRVFSLEELEKEFNLVA